MMNRKPTPQLNRKTLELISAYLDGQLPEAQRRQVRLRLSQDAAFKQAYEDLRLTRLALRSAPQFKRRRSFTLTPEMVGQRAGGFSMQAASRLVAVVATVLLVAVFAGDVFFFRGGVQSVSLLGGMNNAAESVAEDAANYDRMEAEPSGGGGEMPLALEQTAADEDAAEDDWVEGEAAAAPAEPEAVEGTDAAADEAGEDDSGAEDGNAGFAAASPQPSPTLPPEATEVPEAERAAPTDEITTEEAVEQAAAEVEGEDEEIMALAVPEEEAATKVETGEEATSWLLIVELALLAVALGSGVVALLTRRR